MPRPHAATTIAATYVLFAVLALAYTVPPLKLSHRGFGEIDVALTHSAGAILAGYVAQGGTWTDSAPWLLSLPLGLAVLPSILLAGCPDRDGRPGRRQTHAGGHARATALPFAWRWQRASPPRPWPR